MADPTAHYAKPFTDEQVEGFRRDWRRYFAENGPTVPPIGNVDLALELYGVDLGERRYALHGAAYRAPPTSYPHGLQLIRLSQRLERFQAMEGIVGQLQELATVYQAMRQVFYQAMRPETGVWVGEDPLYDVLLAQDYHDLNEWLLASGNELPIYQPPLPADAVVSRYDSAFYLVSFRATFGVMPETWREYVAWFFHQRRVDAERSLQIYGATAMAQSLGDEKARQQWVLALARESGQR